MSAGQLVLGILGVILIGTLLVGFARFLIDKVDDGLAKARRRARRWR